MEDLAARSERDEASQTAIARTLAAFDSYGDRVALTVDAPAGLQSWTYRDLRERVYREARRLTGHGVQPGTVVAVLTGDAPETFVLRWAVNTLGAVVTVLADGFSAPVLAELLETSGAGLVVTNRERAGLAATAAELAGGRVGVVDLDTTAPPADASPVAIQARPGELSSISLTGGSTGTPKAVPRYGPRIDSGRPSGPSPWQGAVQLLCTPVAHVGGSLVAAGVFGAGGRVVLQAGFDPARVLAAIPREQVTVISLMPRLLHQLLDHPDLPGTDTSSLRSITLGSAPAAPERIGEAIERFGPIVAQGYGSTEATNISWISAAELARPELRGSVGRPSAGAEVTIRREDGGSELPTGQIGEVCVRTPMMSGYLNAPDQTAAVFRDGWLRTGDLGYLDSAGYLWLVGRRSEVIFAERARIYPNEIETCLLAHPDVAAAAVFAQRDDDGSESAAVAVVPRPGRSPVPAELIAWVTERRGANLAPTVVYLVGDLPLTHSAKVDREGLRRRFASA